MLRGPTRRRLRQRIKGSCLSRLPAWTKEL